MSHASLLFTLRSLRSKHAERLIEKKWEDVSSPGTDNDFESVELKEKGEGKDRESKCR